MEREGLWQRVVEFAEVIYAILRASLEILRNWLKNHFG